MPDVYEIQLEGSVKIAPVVAGVAGTFVDYTTSIANCSLGRGRNTVDRKPTYADAKTIKRAADLFETLTLGYVQDHTVAAGLQHLLWTTLGTAPCVLAFQAIYKTGIVSATNPGYSGFFTVVDVGVGAAAGESLWTSKTFPAFGVAETTSPFP
jgi:hypothetical protein